jgi:hypothetical protein
MFLPSGSAESCKTRHKTRQSDDDGMIWTRQTDQRCCAALRLAHCVQLQSPIVLWEAPKRCCSIQPRNCVREGHYTFSKRQSTELPR